MAALRRDLSKEILLLTLPKDIPDDYVSRLKSRYPGITIRWRSMLSSSQVFGPSDLPREDQEDLCRGVTILCTQLLPDANLLPNCHYVQLTAAGPDRAVSHPLYQNPGVTFCSTNGVHPPQIAEWAIGTWIAHRHHFRRYISNQENCYWPSNYERATAYVEDSPGHRMGILGYGAIGRQVAKLAQAMGMEVYVYTSRDRPTAESKRDASYCVPGTGDPDGLIPSAWFHGTSREAVNSFLAQDLDVLFMALPLTSQTRQILSSDQFAILSKRKTFVINVGRGAHIDTPALISALEKCDIKGAALDVTDPEPLPPEHPLWKASNVFITPHVSWQTPNYFTRVMDILEQNLERLSNGQKLINEIDKDLNY